MGSQMYLKISQYFLATEVFELAVMGVGVGAFDKR